MKAGSVPHGGPVQACNVHRGGRGTGAGKVWCGRKMCGVWQVGWQSQPLQEGAGRRSVARAGPQLQRARCVQPGHSSACAGWCVVAGRVAAWRVWAVVRPGWWVGWVKHGAAPSLGAGVGGCGSRPTVKCVAGVVCNCVGTCPVGMGWGRQWQWGVQRCVVGEQWGAEPCKGGKPRQNCRRSLLLEELWPEGPKPRRWPSGRKATG